MSPQPDNLRSTSHMVDYDENSAPQKQWLTSRHDLLRGVVRDMGVSDGEFVVADLGCGPGQNSLEAVRPSIDAYRTLSPDAPLVVRHCDQPDNDWTNLMRVVHGPHGYASSTKNLRVEMAAGSFYDVMAAPASVALATCFAASHWSSRALYISSPGAILFSDLRGEARAAMVELARADWTQFLRSRAVELRPGGTLVVSTLGSVPDPTELNGTRSSARKLYRAMCRVMQAMADDGLISHKAVDEFIFPLWFPSVDEMDAPVRTQADVQDAFDIVATDVFQQEGSGQDAFGDAIGDPQRYGELYSNYTRAFAETTLRLHLFARSTPSPEEIDQLTDAFFERLAALYAAEPGVHAFEALIVTQVLRRRAG